MESPSSDLASHLVDVCPNDRQEDTPVFVHFNGDNLDAAYQCRACQKTWITPWVLSYRKADSLPTPQPNPACKGCGSPLGQPHQQWCSFGGIPQATAPTSGGIA